MTDARPPEPMKEPRSWRLRRLRAAGLFALALIAAWVYEPWSRSGPPLCLVRLITGVPCPGCGMTRSVCAASHGHWSDALAFHWLGPLALAVMAGGQRDGSKACPDHRRDRSGWFVYGPATAGEGL